VSEPQPARLPLLPADGGDDPLVEAVFEKFTREGRMPIALYRALAHSPQMLRAYSQLATGLRYDAQTPRLLRELVILRIAQLTGSRYEWSHHASIAGKLGIDERKVASLANWSESELFDRTERAALRCAEEMHALALSDEAFEQLRAALHDDSAVVEIVLLAAFYEAVARMIQALGIDVEPEYAGYLDGLT
jgi:alkylhydroperoxidase family enzyme